jgi:hypothetical protein
MTKEVSDVIKVDISTYSCSHVELIDMINDAYNEARSKGGRHLYWTLEGREEYDSTTGELVLNFTRPETEKEKKMYERWAREAEQREREAYEKLKKKFENNS